MKNKTFYIEQKKIATIKRFGVDDSFMFLTTKWQLIQSYYWTNLWMLN